MADRYWVGGTAAWDATAGTKWAATSGGAGGETVPTTADDVYFDAASTGTVTISTGNTGAKSINCTGFTGGIAGTGAITVAGSITLSATQTYTHTGTVTISGTGTLITAGNVFSGVTVNGSGITVTLGDALLISPRTLTLFQGTFDTASYNVTAGNFESNNTNVRTINLNSSVISLITTLNFGTGLNLTLNSGTSQINFSSQDFNFTGGNKTFYNVTGTSGVSGSRTFYQSNTFNNLTINPISSGIASVVFVTNQTITESFTCSGGSAIARIFCRPSAIGNTITITAGTLVANDCDFRDITIAGTASGTAPTRAGDCGGNTGITFPAAKTVYRVGTSTGWVSSVSWALTSGGTASIDNFPLAQDTAIIDDNTALTGILAVTVAFYNIGTLNASARTTAITFNNANATSRYGDYILGSGVTVSGTSTQTFLGRGTQTFTSAGKTITFPITIDKFSGSFDLGDAFISSSAITVTMGTFNANNYNLTVSSFSSSNSNIRTINMGSGLWTLSGTISVWTIDATNLTFNKNTANILLSNTSTTSRIFTGGVAISYNKLTIGGATGTSVLTLISGTFTELDSTKTVAHTIRFNASSTVVIDTWSVAGTVGNVVTVDSSSAGARRTINITNSTLGLVDYMSVKDIGVSPAGVFYVGDNSTNGGNNLNVYFTSIPIPLDTGNMFFMFN